MPELTFAFKAVVRTPRYFARIVTEAMWFSHSSWSLPVLPLAVIVYFSVSMQRLLLLRVAARLHVLDSSWLEIRGGPPLTATSYWTLRGGGERMSLSSLSNWLHSG